MNPLPVAYSPKALDDLRDIRAELTPTVRELLVQIGSDYARYSLPTSVPRRPALEAGLWCRHPDGRATLIEVIFHVEASANQIIIRRVLIRETSRLPGWVADPSEWPGEKPWPVVDI